MDGEEWISTGYILAAAAVIIAKVLTIMFSLIKYSELGAVKFETITTYDFELSGDAL